MSCKVSFIGLGVMGYPMAGFISKAGHNVTVYNRTKSKAEKWIKEYKGKIAATPEEAAKDSDFVFTCVGNDDDLKEVALGKKGIFNTIKKNSIYIDNTTASAKIGNSNIIIIENPCHKFLQYINVKKYTIIIGNKNSPKDIPTQTQLNALPLL